MGKKDSDKNKHGFDPEAIKKNLKTRNHPFTVLGFTPDERGPSLIDRIQTRASKNNWSAEYTQQQIDLIKDALELLLPAGKLKPPTGYTVLNRNRMGYQFHTPGSKPKLSQLEY